MACYKVLVEVWCRSRSRAGLTSHCQHDSTPERFEADIAPVQCLNGKQGGTNHARRWNRQQAKPQLRADSNFGEPQMLIVRVWHGMTREADAAAYLRHVETKGIGGCHAVECNRCAFALSRGNGVAEFLVISLLGLAGVPERVRWIRRHTQAVLP